MSKILNLGQANKTEKFTILSEAINVINALRIQNTHLREEKADLCQELTKLSAYMQQREFPGSVPPSSGSCQSTIPPGTLADPLCLLVCL